MKQASPPCATSGAFLREAAFLSIAGCQVNPVVLRIRDDGPALLDDGATVHDYLAAMAKARVEPQA